MTYARHGADQGIERSARYPWTDCKPARVLHIDPAVDAAIAELQHALSHGEWDHIRVARRIARRHDLTNIQKLLDKAGVCREGKSRIIYARAARDDA